MAVVILHVHKYGKRKKKVTRKFIKAIGTKKSGKFISPRHRPLLTPPPPLQEIFLALIYVRGRVDIVWPEGFKSMENSNDCIGNQTRDLLTCSVLP